MNKISRNTLKAAALATVATFILAGCAPAKVVPSLDYKACAAVSYTHLTLPTKRIV